jgi:hypothetical protein
VLRQEGQGVNVYVCARCVGEPCSCAAGCCVHASSDLANVDVLAAGGITVLSTLRPSWLLQTPFAAPLCCPPPLLLPRRLHCDRWSPPDSIRR